MFTSWKFGATYSSYIYLYCISGETNIKMWMLFKSGMRSFERLTKHNLSRFSSVIVVYTLLILNFICWNIGATQSSHFYFNLCCIKLNFLIIKYGIFNGSTEGRYMFTTWNIGATQSSYNNFSLFCSKLSLVDTMQGLLNGSLKANWPSQVGRYTILFQFVSY